MTYCSVLYLAIFLPLTVILYNVLPQKHRWKVLLIMSYLFFFSISRKLIIFIILSSFSIHHFGLWLSSIQEERNKLLKEAEKEAKKGIRAEYLKKQRRVLILATIIHIGILLVLKYTGFIGENINALFKAFNLSFSITIPKLAMPIGISFYTLQAVSYIVDVYHEKIQADKNLGRLCLFMTFFPQIVEGPICRYSETAMQLWEGKRTTFKDLTYGMQRIGYGMLKKLIIADRLNTFIGNIFTGYAELDGGVAFIGMVLYTLQLYMDFSGTMDMVIGSAEIFGVKMPENFRQPFFSKTISEFWTRWHITLGAWLRDYVFYPLSLSEPLKKLTTNGRKKLGKHYGPLLASAIALFCVWFSNGLWHGAAWTFIFFGMYHFVLILSGKIFEPQTNWIKKKLHINSEHFLYKGFQIIRTVLLVFVGELFFRAETLKAGFTMLGKMFSNFTLESITNGKILTLDMDVQDFVIIAIFTIFFFVMSILKEKNIDIREKIASKNIVIRWVIYYSLMIAILIFGAYGIGYLPVDPMYAGF